MGPAAAALISAGSSLVTNVFSAREARRNRDFQERMSSTAHRREVEDLRAAGINPMLRQLSGANTPAGAQAQFEDSGSKGVSTALQSKLLEAQINREDATAMLARNQAAEIANSAGNRRQLEQLQIEISGYSAEQARQTLPFVIERAKEEVRLTANSARGAEARAVLDELEKTGRMNIEAFERSVGEMGPWVRVLFNLYKTAVSGGSRR